MTTNTRRNQYRVGGLSISEINRCLQDIGLRLDQLGAVGQHPDMKGKALVNLGTGISGRQSVRYSQLPTLLNTIVTGGTAISITIDEDAITIALKIKPATGLDADDDGLFIDIKAASGLAVDADGLQTVIKAASGLKVDADGLQTVIKAASGLAVDADGLQTVIKAASGLAVDADGLQTVIKSASGLKVDADGLQLKQQAHIADAATAHAITDPADTPADADALRDDLVTNTIPAIESGLDALGTKINSLLAALETAEVLAGS
jgi:hypothetical protein